MILCRILFRSQDLSEVKEYCIQTWTKILAGKVSIHDFTFAKEVRLGTYRCIVRQIAHKTNVTLIALSICDTLAKLPHQGPGPQSLLSRQRKTHVKRYLVIAFLT